MADGPLASPAPAVEAVQPPPRRGLSTFSSLRYRDYRFLWLAQLGRAGAMWMEQIARPVLILQLTDSELLLGLVVAVRMAPQLLLGLVAGVVADRFDRRRTLLVAQCVTMGSHFLLAALVLSSAVEPWHVFALAFATGTSMVFNQTARQALISQIVPQEGLLNAVALNTVALNLMRIVGPALAGVLLLWGIGQVYLLSGSLSLGVIICLSLIRVRYEREPTAERTSWFADVREGIAFAARTPVILVVLLPPLIMFIFGLPYQSVFVPLFAKDVLGLGDSGVGALVVVTGAGAIVGSLIMASQAQLHRRGLLLVGFIALFGTLLLLFSRSTALGLSIVLLMGVSAMSSSYMSLTNSLLLEQSPAEMRGRVMSLMSIDRGLVPLGATIAGALAATLGPQDGLLVMALVILGLTSVLALAAPALRRL